MYVAVISPIKDVYLVGPFKTAIDAENWMRQIRKDAFFSQEYLFNWICDGPLSKTRAVKKYGKDVLVLPNTTLPVLIGNGGIIENINTSIAKL